QKVFLINFPGLAFHDLLNDNNEFNADRNLLLDDFVDKGGFLISAPIKINQFLGYNIGDNNLSLPFIIVIIPIESFKFDNYYGFEESDINLNLEWLISDAYDDYFRIIFIHEEIKKIVNPKGEVIHIPYGYYGKIILRVMNKDKINIFPTNQILFEEEINIPISIIDFLIFSINESFNKKEYISHYNVTKKLVLEYNFLDKRGYNLLTSLKPKALLFVGSGTESGGRYDIIPTDEKEIKEKTSKLKKILIDIRENIKTKNLKEGEERFTHYLNSF
ncbi:unnamed protein product, partial [marine sediment metagenome]